MNIFLLFSVTFILQGKKQYIIFCIYASEVKFNSILISFVSFTWLCEDKSMFKFL